MTTIKLHYDGWLTLPAGLRQTLGLNSGDRIEVTLVDGTLVLWPATKIRKTATSAVTKTKAGGDSSPATTSLTGGAPTVAPEPRAKHQEGSAIQTATAAAPKRRGRPPKVPVANAPLPPAGPLVGIGPAKLVKKAELEAKPTVSDSVVGPPVLARRLRPDSGAQPVERRPFRNVEVRSLGAGHSHGKRRQPVSSSRLFS